MKIKIDEATKRRVEAECLKLQAEVMTLKDVMDEAIHWDQPDDITAALKRIRGQAQTIAHRLNLGELTVKT